SLEDAQVNVVQRMLARHHRLLGPEDMRRAAREDPGVVAPSVLFRHRRELEPPEAGEGFARVGFVPFRPEPRAGFEGRGLLLWYDGIVWSSRSGARTPISPDDMEISVAWRDVVRRHLDEGWTVLGLSWQPEAARGTRTAEQVEALFARAHQILG